MPKLIPLNHGVDYQVIKWLHVINTVRYRTPNVCMRTVWGED